MTTNAKELTPAQKAAQTRAANKAAKAAQKAQEAVQEESELTPMQPQGDAYKAVVEQLRAIYKLGLNTSVSRTGFALVLQEHGLSLEDK